MLEGWGCCGKTKQLRLIPEKISERSLYFVHNGNFVLKETERKREKE